MGRRRACRGPRATGGGTAKRSSSKGHLRNSITVVKDREGVFVGVLRSAQGRGRQSLYNVAAVHEFGSPAKESARSSSVRTAARHGELGFYLDGATSAAE